jgi:hypothetical protein
MSNPSRSSSADQPLLLLFGPAGSGKSTAGRALRDRFGFLHIEIDRYPEDGMVLEGLHAAWEPFWRRGDPAPLASELRRRAVEGKAAGTVLTFPSLVIPRVDHVAAAGAAGIAIAVLYGSGAECVSAWLGRERASGRNLSMDHWATNNAATYAGFSMPRFEPYRVSAFRDGRFRDPGEIADELRKRAMQE